MFETLCLDMLIYKVHIHAYTRCYLHADGRLSMSIDQWFMIRQNPQQHNKNSSIYSSGKTTMDQINLDLWTLDRLYNDLPSEKNKRKKKHHRQHESTEIYYG